MQLLPRASSRPRINHYFDMRSSIRVFEDVLFFLEVKSHAPFFSLPLPCCIAIHTVVYSLATVAVWFMFAFALDLTCKSKI